MLPVIQNSRFAVHTFRCIAFSSQPCVFIFMTSKLTKRLLAAFAAAVGATITACGSGGGGGGDTALVEVEAAAAI